MKTYVHVRTTLMGMASPGIVKMWKPPKCPPADQRKMRSVCPHSSALLSRTPPARGLLGSLEGVAATTPTLERRPLKLRGNHGTAKENLKSSLGV